MTALLDEVAEAADSDEIDVRPFAEKVKHKMSLMGQVMLATAVKLNDMQYMKSHAEEKFEKSLSESKCINGLKTLGWV